MTSRLRLMRSSLSGVRALPILSDHHFSIFSIEGRLGGHEVRTPQETVRPFNASASNTLGCGIWFRG